jgi:hypothetical protein
MLQRDYAISVRSVSGAADNAHLSASSGTNKDDELDLKLQEIDLLLNDLKTFL